MTWHWCVTSGTERVRGESPTVVRAAGWVELFLTHTAGIAEAEVSAPGWAPARMVSVDGVIRAEEDTGDADND